MKEALRLWPPVVGTGRELAHDVTVKGYKIPKGSLVAVSVITKKHLISKCLVVFSFPLCNYININQFLRV